MSRTIKGLCEALREQDAQHESGDGDGDAVPEAAQGEQPRKWEAFEERVRHVYDILLNINREKVSVSRDVKLKGRDGIIHQFDVYYEFSRAGLAHRVAIECRDKSRPIEKDAVLAFRSKVSDIPGLQGVMVSARGYQAGAKKFADSNGIVAIAMDELPGVGDLLARRLERIVLPDKDVVGEPFWSLYEVEDGQANGDLFCEHVNGWYGALLFFSKKMADKYLAQKNSSVQSRYAVRGLSQGFLKSFIMIADTHRANFWIVMDIKPKNLIGLVPISRDDLIEDYVLDPQGLPKEPLVMPSLRSKTRL